MYPSTYPPKYEKVQSSPTSSFLRRRRAKMHAFLLAPRIWAALNFFIPPSRLGACCSPVAKAHFFRALHALVGCSPAAKAHFFRASRVFGFSLIFLLSACGMHEQESFNSSSQELKRNTQETDPTKLISKAIAEGQFDKVKNFIESGRVDINHRDDMGRTLLAKTVISREYAITEYLNLKGAKVAELVSVEKKNELGEPIFIDGQPVLEDKEVLIKDREGKTIYDYADGDEIILAILNKDKFNSTFLTEQIKLRAVPDLNPKLLNWLLVKGANPNLSYPKKKTTALIQLVLVNTDQTAKVLQMVKILLSQPSLEINAVKRGKSALMLLCNKKYSAPVESQSLKIAALLVQHPNIDLNLKTKSRRRPGKDCVALAKKKGNHKLAQWLQKQQKKVLAQHLPSSLPSRE